MTALYVALTIWGGGWVTGQVSRLETENKPSIAERMAASLGLLIGLCGLIAQVVS